VLQSFKPLSDSPHARREISVVLHRVLEAFLDPGTIRWMLTLGGGLFVLGILIWLVSWGVFENPVVLAAALGIGTLGIIAAGWWMSLRTRFRMAGQALTFLGCVVAPLNLWFYHAQDLITLEQNLWLGGVVCCLLYSATVYVLRDPFFLYAVEVGVTMTVALFLAELGLASDVANLTVASLALGLISIHSERVFPPESKRFNRSQFGLPLFWSGQVQLGLAALMLLGAQVAVCLAGPLRDYLSFAWPGNWLTASSLAGGTLWLVMTYAYLYSDIVVRRSGAYVAPAAFSLLMALATVVGFNLPLEWLIGILALTALGANLARVFAAAPDEKLRRALVPLALALSSVPMLLGIFLHAASASKLLPAAWISHSYLARGISWPFVGVMVLVAVSYRVSAWLSREIAPKHAMVYFFGSAAAVIVAAAGLLRSLGLSDGLLQAPWLLVIPIGYLVAGRFWRGERPERPLTLAAHAAAAYILIGVLAAALVGGGLEIGLSPHVGQRASLLHGLVFAEAAIFYALASTFSGNGKNLALAATSACAAFWQLLGYAGVPAAFHAPIDALFGVAILAAARIVGIEQGELDRFLEPGSRTTRGRGASAFRIGNAILSVALLASFLQGLARWAVQRAELSLVAALALAIVAAAMAGALVPAGAWRRWYTAAAVAMAGVTLVTLDALIDLSMWEKAEIFCVSAGMLLIVASHLGRFREVADSPSDLVTLGLWLGSLMVTLPLLAATSYRRAPGHEIAGFEELVLILVTLLMLVTGYSWQIKSTTFSGAIGLVLYLVVIVVSLGWRAQVATGVYLAVGGGLVFACGIALSVFREKLLSLPGEITHRKGVFSVLDWR
jgi:hypothetical protein